MFHKMITDQDFNLQLAVIVRFKDWDQLEQLAAHSRINNQPDRVELIESILESHDCL